MNDNQLDDFFSFKSDDEAEKHKQSLKQVILKPKLKLLPKVLSKRERYVILIFIIVAIGSLLAIPITAYYHFTETQPARGGSFSEGIVGEPRHINPLLSQTNDADRDLVSLIYSGLLKYNAEGKLVPDLAKSYDVSGDGLKYTVYLKENARWHDDIPVTADDVVFTIETAQNSDYGSILRINWQGIEVEKISDYAVMFTLKNKYAQFLNNLTINILPKQRWQDIKPINFALSDLNLKPIGSGPYKFSKLKKDSLGRISSYELEANDSFYDGQPFIDKIEIKFYNSQDELVDAYNRNEIDNLSFVSQQDFKRVKFKNRLSIRELKIPRYFGVFINQNQSRTLSDKNVRLALSHATNKNELIKQVLEENGLPVDSPMISGILDINPDVKKYSYDIEQAKTILNTAGWSTMDDKGVRSKGSDRLSLKLTTSTWPELTQVATILKDQWALLGVELEIEVLPTPELQQAIKDRNYQMLLFGEILNLDPDPFSLWHSSQKREPGLNLALYDNKAADTILEEARQTLNPQDRAKKYDDFQKLVIEDIPAILLYNPFYLYAQGESIKGFENKIISTPSDRFLEIEKWYLETTRSLK